MKKILSIVLASCFGLSHTSFANDVSTLDMYEDMHPNIAPENKGLAAKCTWDLQCAGWASDDSFVYSKALNVLSLLEKLDAKKPLQESLALIRKDITNYFDEKYKQTTISEEEVVDMQTYLKDTEIQLNYLDRLLN